MLATVTDSPTPRPVWQQALRRALAGTDSKAKELAKKAGMSPGQFSDIVNNPAQNPTVETLQRIADVVGVPLAALFGGSSPTSSSSEASDASRRSVSAPADLELLNAAIRSVFTDLLVDIARAIGSGTKNLPDAREIPGTRAAQTESGDVPDRTGGTLHRTGTE